MKKVIGVAIASGLGCFVLGWCVHGWLNARDQSAGATDRKQGNFFGRTAGDAETPFDGRRVSGPGGLLRDTEDLLAELHDLSQGELTERIRRLWGLSSGHAGVEDEYLLHVLYERLAEVSPEYALQFVAGRDYKERWIAIPAIFSGWAKTDFAAADAYLREPANNVKLMDKRFHNKMIAGIAVEVSKWPVKDASAWLSSLDNLDPDGVGLIEIVSMIAGSDPQKAALIAGNSSREGKTRGLEIAARCWAAIDPEQAMAWVRTLGEEERVAVFPKVIEGWVEADLEAAVEYANSIAADDPSREDQISAIAKGWSRSDPESAARWALGHDCESGFSEALLKWAVLDPEAVSREVAELPDGSLKDEGIDAIAATIIDSDPKAALTWVMTISDAEFRFAKLKGYSRRWKSFDGDGFMEWGRKVVSELSEQEVAFFWTNFGISQK